MHNDILLKIIKFGKIDKLKNKDYDVYTLISIYHSLLLYAGCKVEDPRIIMKIVE